MLKFYSPLTGDFYENDVDEFGWNNGTVDYPTLFTGSDMSYYADSIQEAVEQRNGDDGGNLMLYFDESRNPDIKAKVMSAVPSVEIQNGVLMGCTTVKLRESLTAPEMEDLLEYLKGQFSDGWGEGFEQQAIQISNGVLNVHELGYVPICSKLSEVQYLQPDNPDEKRDFHSISHQKLGRCRMLVVCGSEISNSMSAEIGAAEKKNIICTTLDGLAKIKEANENDRL